MRSWESRVVDPPFFWPRDGLGVDFSRFRVLSFGYPKSSTQSLSDYARDLDIFLQVVSEPRACGIAPGVTVVTSRISSGTIANEDVSTRIWD